MIARDARGRFENHWKNPLVANIVAKQALHNAAYGLPRGGSQTLGGSDRRDIDDECGFPRRGQIRLEDYAYLFERLSIAARVVEISCRESWKVSPMVTENEDSDTLTTFEMALDELGKSLQGESWHTPSSTEEGNPLWQKLQLVDELSGIGAFGVLLIGLKGDEDLSQPANGIAEDGSKVGNASNEIIYLRAYDQTKVQVDQWETDKQNPRCGQPKMYSITVAGYDTDGASLGSVPSNDSVKVHWSRIIHVADVFHQATASDVFAIPRMRPVYNELLQCRKIAGASGEFYWNHGSRDLIIETHPQLGGKVRFPSNMATQLEQFQTGLQRSLRLAGASAKTLNPAVSDPTPHLMAQVKLIAIKLGCPERVFWGSERGELASSQDEKGWADRMAGRENGYITPGIIVPALDRFIILGALPTPKEYFVSWPSLREQGPSERATVASQRTEAMAKYVGGNVYPLIAPIDFLTRELDYTQEEAVQILKTAQEEMEEMEPAIPADQSQPSGEMEDEDPASEEGTVGAD
jgi:hypothetical protein